jgi:hypothetical protein
MRQWRAQNGKVRNSYSSLDNVVGIGITQHALHRLWVGNHFIDQKELRLWICHTDGLGQSVTVRGIK